LSNETKTTFSEETKPCIMCDVCRFTIQVFAYRESISQNKS